MWVGGGGNSFPNKALVSKALGTDGNNISETR